MSTRLLGRSAVHHALLAAGPIVLAMVVACSSGDDDTAASSPDTTAEPEDLEMQAEDFVPLRDMTPVRGFFVDNRLGHLDAAIALAEDPDGGGEYPVGTIVQLIPTEAMVKRYDGFDDNVNDWEFFSLEVSAEGTEILSRGGAEVINQFQLSCVDCHSLAEPEFDFICENTHGCDPLPIGDDVITAVQQADPRPSQG